MYKNYDILLIFSTKTILNINENYWKLLLLSGRILLFKEKAEQALLMVTKAQKNWIEFVRLELTLHRF